MNHNPFSHNTHPDSLPTRAEALAAQPTEKLHGMSQVIRADAAPMYAPEDIGLPSVLQHSGGDWQLEVVGEIEPDVWQGEGDDKRRMYAGIVILRGRDPQGGLHYGILGMAASRDGNGKMAVLNDAKHMVVVTGAGVELGRIGDKTNAHGQQEVPVTDDGRPIVGAPRLFGGATRFDRSTSRHHAGLETTSDGGLIIRDYSSFGTLCKLAKPPVPAEADVTLPNDAPAAVDVAAVGGQQVTVPVAPHPVRQTRRARGPRYRDSDEEFAYKGTSWLGAKHGVGANIASSDDAGSPIHDALVAGDKVAQAAPEAVVEEAADVVVPIADSHVAEPVVEADEPVGTDPPVVDTPAVPEQGIPVSDWEAVILRDKAARAADTAAEDGEAAAEAEVEAAPEEPDAPGAVDAELDPEAAERLRQDMEAAREVLGGTARYMEELDQSLLTDRYQLDTIENELTVLNRQVINALNDGAKRLRDQGMLVGQVRAVAQTVQAALTGIRVREDASAQSGGVAYGALNGFQVRGDSEQQKSLLALTQQAAGSLMPFMHVNGDVYEAIARALRNIEDYTNDSTVTVDDLHMYALRPLRQYLQELADDRQRRTAQLARTKEDVQRAGGYLSSVMVPA